MTTFFCDSVVSIAERASKPILRLNVFQNKLNLPDMLAGTEALFKESMYLNTSFKASHLSGSADIRPIVLQIKELSE